MLAYRTLSARRVLRTVPLHARLSSAVATCPSPSSSRPFHNGLHAAAMELDASIVQLIERVHRDETKAVVLCTGGGVQAVSWLLSVPGASNTVLECSVPYARDSLKDILGYEPDQYCSEDTAVVIAKAAYKRAAKLSPFGTRIVGVGATCALATVPPKRGPHRAFIACHDGERGTHVASVNLSKGARTRMGEDTLVSMVLLQVLAQACGIDPSCLSLPLTHTLTQSHTPSPSHSLAPPTPQHAPHAHTPFATVSDGGAAGRRAMSADIHTAALQPSVAPLAATAISAAASSTAAATAATEGQPQAPEPDEITQTFVSVGDPLERLLAGEVRCVEFARGRVVVDAPRRDKIYLPGSFNPLHEGHTELLQAAYRLLNGDKEAAFELSVGNPDKGYLALDQVRQRVQQFIDADLPVVVTSAPLFTTKSQLLPGSCFVVGYDTAIRLVMPKYYNNSEAEMLVQFATLRQQGCSFLVAGRKDPATNTFKTLQDVQMHPGLADLFMALNDFRIDLSSTEIRQRSMSPMSD